jgi:hypothetical protein
VVSLKPCLVIEKKSAHQKVFSSSKDMHNTKFLEQVFKEREIVSTCIKTHLHNANRCLNISGHLAIVP